MTIRHNIKLTKEIYFQNKCFGIEKCNLPYMLMTPKLRILSCLQLGFQKLFHIGKEHALRTKFKQLQYVTLMLAYSAFCFNVEL